MTFGSLGDRVARVLGHPRADALILTLSVLVTGAAWWVSSEAQAQRVRDRFTFRTGEVQQAIERRLLEYENVLRGGVGFFEASQVVSRTEWRTYVQTLHIEDYYPGIQGVGFTVRIPAAALERHQAEVRAEGFPAYAVRPPGPRDEYHSIVYLEPFEGRNLRAFGFDMYSEAVRREAMDRARDTGEAALSGGVTLVQETDRDVQRGFLMYVPVYRPGSRHDDLASRRANLLGFVYSPFRTRDLMAGILGSAELDVDYQITDGPSGDPASLLFSTRPGAETRGRLAMERQVTIGGRRWDLRFALRPDLDGARETGQPLAVALGGLLIDLLLFVLIRLKQRSAARARAAAAELRASLQEKEVLLKEVHHRVKNNLQVISSLLGLQGRLFQDARSRELLEECRARVLSMALVHEKLYHSGDLTRVDLADYLRTLVAQLEQGQLGRRDRVRVVVEAEPVRASLERAIPIGLILNELVTNALKHAFPGERAGTVRISLRLTGGGGALLEVADDGVGLPAGIECGTAATLGLQLVSMLARQLDGQLSCERAGGTLVRLTFAAV